MKIFYIFFFLYTLVHGKEGDLLPERFNFAFGAIVYKDSDYPRCVGGFITKNTILTTAHCLFCDQDCNFEVYVQRTDTTITEKYPVAEWEINENYDGTNPEDDIGFVRVENEIPDYGILKIPPRSFYGKSYRPQGFTFTGKYQNGVLTPNFNRIRVISSELCSFTLGTYISQDKVCAYSHTPVTYQSYHQGVPLLLYGEFGTVFYGIYNTQNIHTKPNSKISVYQLVHGYNSWVKSRVFHETRVNCTVPPGIKPLPQHQPKLFPTMGRPTYAPPHLPSYPH